MRAFRKAKTLTIFVLVLAAASSVVAADRQALKERFKQRYPQLKELKTQGRIGETWEGYVEAVAAGSMKDPAVADSINLENADRKELYEIIASEEKVPAATVAERNAARAFTRAAPGEYLKDRSGEWRRKAE